MWEEIISGLEDFRILKEEASEKAELENKAIQRTLLTERLLAVPNYATASRPGKIIILVQYLAEKAIAANRHMVMLNVG